MEDVRILAHPNIPKPLHGVAPRAIMGTGWWNNKRKVAYAQHNQRCWACGIHKSQADFHQWLEAHEFYEIDYKNGKMYFKEVVALCHACHNFIHSQRLYAILKKGEISRDRAYFIINRGLDLCFENGVTPYIGLKDIVEELGLVWENYWEPEATDVAWADWRLVFEGKEYGPVHETIEAWAEHYNVELGDM